MLTEEQLTAQQRRQKEHLVQASEELAKAYRLSQDFVATLKERKAEELQPWLQRASHSQIAEFKSLAKSMQGDYAAIHAACSQSWSQGQVEGQGNRLKCIKRQSMAEPTLTFCGCAFFMWPRMTRMSWISLTSSLIVLCPKQAAGFTKSGGEPIYSKAMRWYCLIDFHQAQIDFLFIIHWILWMCLVFGQ